MKKTSTQASGLDAGLLPAVVACLACGCVQLVPHTIRQEYPLPETAIADDSTWHAAQHLGLVADGGEPGHFFIAATPANLALEVHRTDAGFDVAGLTSNVAPYDAEALGRVPRVLAAATLAEAGSNVGAIASPRSAAFTVAMDVMLPALGAFYTEFNNPYFPNAWLGPLLRIVPDICGISDLALFAALRGTRSTALDGILVGGGIALLVLDRLLGLLVDTAAVRALNALSESGYPVPDPLPVPTSTVAQ